MVLFLLIIFILAIIIIVIINENSGSKQHVENVTRESFDYYDKIVSKEIIKTPINYDLNYIGYESVEFDLAGLYYRSNNAKEEASTISEGEEVKLRLNPTNEYDNNAVKVIYNNLHIGFTPSSKSEYITNFIKSHKDITAIVTSNNEEYNTKFDDYENIISVKVYGKISTLKKEKQVTPERYDYFKDHAGEIIDKKIPKEFSQKNLDIEDKSSIFYDKSIVITGSFNYYSRDDIANYIYSKGGCLRSSLTSATDFVIVGSINPGPSKLVKIDELIKSHNKLKVIQENEFLKIIQK